MTTFQTTFEQKKRPFSKTYTEQLLKWIGGLSIVSLAILALPFTFLVAIWVWLRPNKANSTDTIEVLENEWEIILQKPDLQLYKRWNGALDQYISKHPELAHDLATNEFIAYQMKAHPRIKELDNYYFDYPMLEWEEGILLKTKDPFDDSVSSSIYFLCFSDRQLEHLGDIPGGYEVEMKRQAKAEFLIIGKNDLDQFKMTVKKTHR